MSWQVAGKAEKRLNDIAQAVKGAAHLYLATDPDREGEAISWHVEEVLRNRKALKGVDVKRVVFNEVTKAAVLDAFRHPRALNRELVDAYLARRALDYLVGFTLSPVLWRKLPGSRSAGRVQSVALRLDLRARERDRGLQGARILEHRGRVRDAVRRALHRAPHPSRRQEARQIRYRRRDEGARRRRQHPEAARATRWRRSRRSRSAARRRRLSPPRPCSRKPRASSASARAAPCAWRSVSTRASTSSARRSVSLLICAPTASPCRPRRSRRRAGSSSSATARTTGRASRASTRPRRRTRRKRMRRSARPTWRVAGEGRARFEPDQLRALRAHLEARGGEPDVGRRSSTRSRSISRRPTSASQFRATGSTIGFDGFLTLYHEDEDDRRGGRGERPPAAAQRAPGHLTRGAV